ncbi:MAG: 16S rRNA (cytosine(1402)-N(4))-methyltransferase RsmH [Bdellovibrionota bacterium]|jgi:16S rRNA (cytosine1402-N4)-methyltransferase
MMLEKTTHISVMKKEATKYLGAKEGGVFLDCTLGGGGHTKALLDANKNNIVYAIDRDINAIERARKFLKDYKDRLFLYNFEFSKADSDVFNGIKFDGILADLGLSTDQLKEDRGFSFNDESFLDMRMDKEAKLTANEIVNETESKELFRILKEGGVGKEASSIVNVILKNRPIETSKELADIIKSVSYKFFKGKKVHPATVVFQAIRIAVNNEFEEIKKLLSNVPDMAKAKTRLVVISFHSLEDKIVASTMRRWQKGENDNLSLIPIKETAKGLGKLITKKSLVPSDEEVLKNPASRSSLMRVFEFY